MSNAISIRLSNELVHKLEDLSGAMERSKTYIIRKALESYLQEYNDSIVALERLIDKDDEIISSEEMREQLGL
jgi:RHH-type rel operon transcriptional repressor/antitoxin RelB